MFFLCESEASAAIVFSVRKRSVSSNCFFCAKAKRQQQLFFLCESEASAAAGVKPRNYNKSILFYYSKRSRTEITTFKAPEHSQILP
ncbi:hypothetical protein [Lysinibacillus sp. FJAT-14222]|uniref:hypothetical protein n=1 Tax=Lysinibacillus sp. FJAT-14222 TaxID=1932366 RepID=UPI0011605445|nr:hypothetical protein [Lysinibacillus sp. FJAT-14222]